MQPVLLQILEKLVWLLYQNLLCFAVLYLFWMVFKIVFKNDLKSKTEFLILFILLSIGTIHFIANSFQIFNGTTKPNYLFGGVKSVYYFDVIAIFFSGMYVFFCVQKLIIFLAKAVFNKKDHFAIFANPDLDVYLKDLAAYLNIKKPTIYICSNTQVPYTKGFLKKIIVLPIALINNLSEQELEAVLLHEIAHIKRHDHYTNLLIIFSDLFLFFNPFAKLFVKEIKLQRELACDDWVLKQNIRPKHYATALQKTATLSTKEKKLQLAMFVPKNELFYRIKRLFGEVEKRKNKIPVLHFAVFIMASMVMAFHISNTKKPIVTGKDWLFARKDIFNTNQFVLNSNQPLSKVIVAKKATKRFAKIPKIAPQTVQNIIPFSDKVKVQAIEEPFKIEAVADKQNGLPLTTNVLKNTIKVNNTLLKVEDSIVYYNNTISSVNIENSTSGLLNNIIKLIADLQNEKENLAIASDPIPITVTQEDGSVNLFYKNMNVTQNVVFNKQLNCWVIMFNIKNDAIILATRILQIKIDRKLNTINL